MSEVKETLKILFVREVKDKTHVHAIYSNEAGRREDTEARQPVMYVKTFAARRGHDGRPILPLLYVENRCDGDLGMGCMGHQWHLYAILSSGSFNRSGKAAPVLNPSYYRY